MTLSSAIANYGLSALATPTGTNVANDVKVGVSPSSMGFATADIAYSFLVTATGSSDVATLTFATGAVAQTTGTPTIADGDGNDFEGVTLPTTVTVYAVLVEVVAGSAVFGVHDDGWCDFADGATGDVLLRTSSTGKPNSADTLAITLPTVADSVRVTVIGKSS